MKRREGERTKANMEMRTKKKKKRAVTGNREGDNKRERYKQRRGGWKSAEMSEMEARRRA